MLSTAAVVLALVGLTAGPGTNEVTPIRVGQGIWRPRATVTEFAQTDGGPRPVQADLFGLSLDAAQPVRILLRAEGRLGLAVYDVAGGPGGEPKLLGSFRPGQELTQTLGPGNYMLVVAGDPPGDGAYLLTVSGPPVSPAKLERQADAAPGQELPRLVGTWRLPQVALGVAVAPGGQLAATWDQAHALLHDLATGRSYPLSAEPGTLRRVAFAADGWSVLVVSDGGARLLALPDGVPFARFVAEGGGAIHDAVYAGYGQRVAVLPADGNVFLSSPVPGDLAWLPGSRGTAIESDAAGQRLAVRRAASEIALFDVASRELIARSRWPEPPGQMALHPDQPMLAVVVADAALLWRGGLDPQTSKLPGQVSVAYSPDGRLALADGKQVALLYGGNLTALEPPVAATRVACSPDATTVAATAGRQLAVWEVGAASDDSAMEEARLVYLYGMTAYQESDFPTAEEHFRTALTALEQLPQATEVEEVICLILLRLCQTTYQLKQYDLSLRQAITLGERGAKLPEGPARTGYVSTSLYQQGDALWLLDRKPEAKQKYQEALAAGLDEQRAAAARRMLEKE